LLLLPLLSLISFWGMINEALTLVKKKMLSEIFFLTLFFVHISLLAMITERKNIFKTTLSNWRWLSSKMEVSPKR